MPIRSMRTIAALTGVLAAVSIGNTPARADVSASKPVLCAVTQVMDCRLEDTCERVSPDEINLPRFIRVDVGRNTLSEREGQQSAPVHRTEHIEGHVILQGGQGTRAWSMLIAEKSGLMSGAIAEPEGSFVMSGACLNP